MSEMHKRIIENTPTVPDTEKRPMGRGSALVLMGVVLAAALCLSFRIGRYPVSAGELAGILFDRIFPGRIEPFWTDTQAVAVLNVRFPRLMLSVTVGAALSCAGAVFQAAFQNPMASPDILGASTGAGFGAALAILLGMSSTAITLSAFAMSMLTVCLVFFISGFAKGDKVIGLVLSGIMISSLFSAGTSFIKLVADPGNKLPSITYWLMGSLVGATNSGLSFVILPMLAGFIPLFMLRWRLNVITMGDDDARSMGVNPSAVRMAGVSCATLLTAASVSVSGMIGWVGLVIPHMMRRIVGSDYRYLLPASALGGGIFLLMVDNISRSASGGEIPIGILTAFIGAPFFLLLITGRTRQ